MLLLVLPGQKFIQLAGSNTAKYFTQMALIFSYKINGALQWEKMNPRIGPSVYEKSKNVFRVLQRQYPNIFDNWSDTILHLLLLTSSILDL